VVRLCLNVPPPVARFAITESVSLQNVIGGAPNASFRQTVIP
jgi:hypothetical protein